MAAQGPTEYTTDKEHSFCDQLRCWICGSIQVQMIHRVQIAIIFDPGCKIQHRFTCREEKKIYHQNTMADQYFRILKEDNLVY